MMKFWVLPLLLGAAAAAPAQESAAAVTREQVQVYQSSIESGCRDAGRGPGNASAKPDALCACIIATLRENVPFSEWQSAFYYHSHQQLEQEQKVLSPYMQLMGGCRKAP
jgi:hypothetical protein